MKNAFFPFIIVLTDVSNLGRLYMPHCYSHRKESQLENFVLPLAWKASLAGFVITGFDNGRQQIL